MRRTAFIILAAVLAGLGTFAPPTTPAARAATDPKVAIIVGATHGATASYRAAADELYAEAIQYTPNVVRVYSPDATWTKVKAAVNGASIIVYLGHGNGWPAPYPSDPYFTGRDGFGLNADLNGDGKLSDYEVKYYGEPWIRTLTPAPNAVVLLFHLCYASGNSEPGNSEPSLSTASQRADNFAAAFLQTSARAVIAIGHAGGIYYLRELFTSRQTIEDLWRNAPEFNGNVLSFPSSRNPGATVLLDPDSSAPSGFYRALTGKLSLQTQDVTGAAFADTSGDPATFVVPGSASPVADGAPVFGSVEDAVAGATPATTLPATTQVRIDWQEPVQSGIDGSPVFRIHVDGGAEGWMTGSLLTPRDSAPPRLWGVDEGTGSFSPNGDGSHDQFVIAGSISESAAWSMAIRGPDGGVLATGEGQGSTAAITWAPAAGTAPDGEYTWTLAATDAWGNGPLDAHGTFLADTQAPVLSVADASAATAPMVSPNGDGFRDTVAFAVAASEPGQVVGTVRNVAGDAVATVAVAVGSAGAMLTWDGRDTAGAPVPDGRYTVTFQASDLADNPSETQTRPVLVDAALRSVRASTALFFPQDGDTLSARATFAFNLLGPATVTWTIQNAAGKPVRTIMANRALAAGSQAWAWNGRDSSGAFVPRGVYTAVVSAVTGDLVAEQGATVSADAFSIAASDTTPARRQRLTITVFSAESLSGAPRLTVRQPGVGAWSVGTTRVATGVYRATITLRSSATGTLRLLAAGRDSRGRTQGSSISLPLH